MQIPNLLGVAVLCAGIAFIFAFENTPNSGDGAASDVHDSALADTAPANSALAVPPPATGHFVLVVEGDRDRLSITHASHKADPWAGVQKGLSSNWSLSILDDKGAELSVVPLDMSKFDLEPARKGQPVRVEGCEVHDARIAMIANVPSLAAASAYVFTRGETTVGTIDATTVNQLAGVGR